ncbi:hypothetical protein Z947_1484 [Sulfitobacter geojensis]|nr:hypothetical protein Z947_1484 [Sulfitobacter geojensis]
MLTRLSNVPYGSRNNCKLLSLSDEANAFSERDMQWLKDAPGQNRD